jgi:hypothetical protein
MNRTIAARISATITAALMLVLIAGCGGTSEYEKCLNQPADSFRTSGELVAAIEYCKTLQ